MRLPTPLFLAAALSLTACSWTSAGGLTGRIESASETTVESPVGSWGHEAVHVSSGQGGVQIVGVAGKTNISLHARFVAGANSRAEADPAFADLAQTLAITKGDDGWTIHCGHASAWHGDVDPESTGCSSLRVEVPAGTGTPLALDASSDYGGVHVSGVTVAKLDVTAPFGIVADVVPADGAQIRMIGKPLVSGLCSTVLRVPATATIEAAVLTADNASLRYVNVSEDDPTYWLGTYIEGFPGAPVIAPRTAATAWKQGAAPFDATSIELHASLGKAVLTTARVPAYDAFNQCLDIKLEPITVSGQTG